MSNFVGKTAFAAVNLIIPFTMVLSAIGFMLGIGGNALIAKTLGEGKSDLANKIFSFSCLVVELDCDYNKKLVSIHSVLNKVTGCLLFLLPLTFEFIEPIYTSSVVCFMATLSAINEVYYTRIGKEVF